MLRSGYTFCNPPLVPLLQSLNTVLALAGLFAKVKSLSNDNIIYYIIHIIL